MNKSSAVILWVARKALYTVAGTVLGIAATYVTAHPNFEGATLVGAVAGLGAAVVGDLRRAFAKDFAQVLQGVDPRKDG